MRRQVFAGEQLHGLTTSPGVAITAPLETNKPKARWRRIEREIRRWLSAPFLAELIRYQVQEQDGGWHLQFDFDSAAFFQLLSQRLGRAPCC